MRFSFLKCPSDFQRFTMIFQRLPNIAENVQRSFGDLGAFLKLFNLACCDTVRT